MATSNSINYSQNRNEIISDALSLLGVIGAGGTPVANDITFCSNQLNKMVKAWQARGIHLWKETEAVIPLVNAQNKYVLVTDRMGDNPVETQLTASASGSSLTVTSTTGMTAGDNIGVALDANTRTWTTISSVDSSTTLTLAAPVASVASSGNNVITYTTASTKPFHITNIRYKYNGGVERQIKKMGRAEYMNLTNKDNTGTVTAYYYSPQISTGLLYLWLTPNNVNDVLHCSYIRTIQDFDSSSDDADFPQEWLGPITRNLAVYVAPAFGLTLSKSNPDLVMEAAKDLREMEAWDSEEGSVYFVPNYRDDY